jgi:uncharacterized protein YwgA
MKTYDFVHLVLYAFDGSIQGRTKLQKIVYFVGALTDLLPDLGYRPHYYGPYSSEVTAAVNELQGLGFLQQTSSSAGAVDPHGFEVARYDYALTPEGKEIAQEKAERFPEEWARIRRVAEHLKSLNANDYVKLSIAAKAYFLLGERDGDATIAELVGMMPRFGWNVTRDQVSEAGEFLESLGLIHLQGSG